MPYRLEEVASESMSDDELTPVLNRINALYREIQPRRVDLTSAEFRMFNSSPGISQREFLVHDDGGEIIGHCDASFNEDGTSPEVLKCQIRVWPEYRRKGAGTSMLGHIAGVAQELGREHLLTWHADTVPAGEMFARAVGAKETLQSHMNVLRIEDLDSGLMRQWTDQGARRARGYSVTVTEGDWPEELLADIAYLHYVLERDMPTPEGIEPREWTADRVREIQDHYKQGTDALWSMAFHDESGKAVGLSELMRRHSDPTTWIVTTTMVDPDHRGKSLGKWLKGAVNLAALESWSGGIYQETGNAFTNEGMLAINRAMGFEHEFTLTEVEIAVDNALAYVASKR